MDETMADTLMFIPNGDTQIILSVDYNQRIKHLDTQQKEPKFNNSPQSCLKHWGLV